MARYQFVTLQNLQNRQKKMKRRHFYFFLMNSPFLLKKYTKNTIHKKRAGGYEITPRISSDGRSRKQRGRSQKLFTIHQKEKIFKTSGGQSSASWGMRLVPVIKSPHIFGVMGWTGNSPPIRSVSSIKGSSSNIRSSSRWNIRPGWRNRQAQPGKLIRARPTS